MKIKINRQQQQSRTEFDMKIIKRKKSFGYLLFIITDKQRTISAKKKNLVYRNFQMRK